MIKNNISQKEIFRIRGLFRIAGQNPISIYANDIEVKILYDLQNQSVRLYNEKYEIDKRIKELEKTILERR